MGKPETLRRQKTATPVMVVPRPPVARRSGATTRPAMAQRRLSIAAQAVPVALVLIGLLFAAWQVAHVRGYTYGTWEGNLANHWSDYDEGVYIVSARALNHGSAIFSQVFSSQPPLFLAGLALALRVAGGAAGAAHLYSLLCGLLALGGVAWLCWEIGGRWPALLACATLALSPGFMVAARAVEAEAPMLGFGSLAVAASARYARVGRLRWLVVAAICVAAAALSKLLAVAVVAPLIVALALSALEHGRQRMLARDAGIALLCCIVPVAVAFLLFAPAEQFDQVVRFHVRASAVYGPTASLRSNVNLFEQFLSWDPGLVVLAVAGMAVAALARLRLAAIPVAWLLATVGTMITYHPLFLHHLTVLLPPLATLGGLSAGSQLDIRAAHIRRVAAVLLLGAALVVYAVWLPVIVRHTGEVFVADHDANKAARAGWLAANSAPGDVVVVDDQTLAVAANRLVPPALTDTSIVRSAAHYLPLSLLIQATSASHVRAVLLTRSLLQNGAYVAWLRRHFQAVRVTPNDPSLAFVRRAGTG